MESFQKYPDFVLNQKTLDSLHTIYIDLEARAIKRKETFSPGPATLKPYIDFINELDEKKTTLTHLKVNSLKRNYAFLQQDFKEVVSQGGPPNERTTYLWKPKFEGLIQEIDSFLSNQNYHINPQDRRALENMKQGLETSKSQFPQG